jgi:iron(III) transport system substrate-binding protein
MIADAIGSSDSAYQQANIPRFAKLVGPDINSPAVGKWLMGEKTFVMSYFVYYGYAWNTQVVPGKPTLKELLDNPAYKGRVGLIDFSRGTTFAVTLDALAKSYVKMFGGTEAEYYAKLKALEPRYYTTVVPIIQAIGSGELAFSPSIAPGFVDPKMPVATGEILSPPAGANYVAVPNGAPHPNAAQVFANWSLTVEGQTVLAENQASVLPNIPTAKVNASQLVYTDTSALTTAAMDALVARQRLALGK